MRMQISQAPRPRAARRTRWLAATIVALTMTCMAAAAFSLGSHPIPLVALDDITVNGAATGEIDAAAILAPPHDDSRQAQATSFHAADEQSATAANAEDQDLRWYNGRPVRPVRTMMMTVTAYSPDARSCGAFADGVTASGYSVLTNGGHLAAADTRVLPFGSMISVPGYDDGNVVPVLDRGGAIKANRLDLLFPTHEQALIWGVQKLQITVWEYADGKPNDFVAKYNRKSSVNP